MVLKNILARSSKLFKKTSLKTILIVPFVIQVSAAVGVISYLAHVNTKKTVEDLVVQLSDRATKDLEARVISYLDKSHSIHQSIVASIDSQLLNLKDYSQIQNYFWHEVKRIEYLSFLYFANKQGDFIGVQHKNDDRYYLHIRDSSTVPNRNTYLLDTEGNTTNNLITSRWYDPRLRAWDRAAQQAKQSTWSPIYSFAASNDTILGISPVTPIYNSSGEFQGVLASDLSLQQISDFLSNVQISDNARAIIMERDGNIIGTSTSSSPFKLTARDKQYRLNISESQDLLVRETAEYLLSRYNNFSEIEDLSSNFRDEDGRLNYLQIKTLKDEFGIDWLIVVTIPETDFTATIDINTRNNIILSLLALAIAIATGILTSQWVAKPILKLNQAAKDIARGNWDKTFEIDRSDEVGELANSFKKMAVQLKQSFSTLEQRVEERTASLKKAVIEAETAKEEAIAANQAKDNFLVNISHELRSPLNSILGYTKLILNADNLNTSQILSLRIVKQSGTHLLTLINDLLDFSKSKAGKIRLNLTQFELLEFIEGVAGIVKMQAREKGLLFNYQVIGPLPRAIKADEQRLRQILLNLLSNAVKFTDRGQVLLRLKQIDRQKNRCQIRFEIIDTGRGMSQSELETIFQPFIQVGNLETRKAGTGLGLSISQELAELMGSKIEVTSKLGQGSTFSLDLSCDVVEFGAVKNIKSDRAQIIGYRDDRPAQILVVDDRKENRLLLLNLLEPLGFKIFEASNGKEGLKMARKIKPDLILTDLLMPEKTGLTMILELRQIPEFSQIPIISVSASNAEIMGKQSLSVGCDAFLPKPIQEEKLFALLQKYLKLNWIFKSESLLNSKVITSRNSQSRDR
ncbi:MAG: ATP-binding protein [Prochloraceae cyanobacterium]